MSGKYGTTWFLVKSVPQTFYVCWKKCFFCFKTGYEVEKKGIYRYKNGHHKLRMGNGINDLFILRYLQQRKFGARRFGDIMGFFK